MTTCSGSCTHRPAGQMMMGRRLLLAGGASLLVAASLPKEAPTKLPIDIHHHIVPPFYKDSVVDWYRQTEAAVGPVLAWTAETMIADLDKAGGARAIMSVSAPATTLARGTDAIQMARRCNDYAAELARSRPGQLAFFATLPMPDVAASIAEIERAMKLTGAVGVALLTSYDGRYLGDPTFDMLMRYLHERGLVAFVHPTVGPCCVGLTPSVGSPLVEFPVDTGRAVSSLLWSGSLARYARIKFVFSHGGGITAMLTERLGLQGFSYADAERRAPGGVDAMLRKIYVDTASATHPAAIAAARIQFGDDNVLFGSDAPWGGVERSLASLDRLNLDPALLDRIRFGNARALIPGFAWAPRGAI